MKNGSGVFSAAFHSARAGDLYSARRQFAEFLDETQIDAHRAQLLNNLAAVEAALGNAKAAWELLEEAAALFPENGPIERNLQFLAAGVSATDRSHRSDLSCHDSLEPSDQPRGKRIALVSLLFNWPSTGGGTVHTKELAETLAHKGYKVRHFYAVQGDWRIGQVGEPLPYPSQPLKFSGDDWTRDRVRECFRNAVREFRPDYVIVTDGWNTKPLLAEAVSEIPYFLRIAALECLCPLNNVRLLVDEEGGARQCANEQLSAPNACRECVSANGRLSGGLHQLERELAGFEEDSYTDRLKSAFANAEGVLVVNPSIARLVEPYARSVHVIPSGFDARRFLASVKPPPNCEVRKLRVLFAGLVDEFMKGFHVLQEAGEMLWQQRQDFEIWATADPPGPVNEYTCYVGWQSQQSLPQLIRECDVLVFPTIAQEALGRTAVEAMGCGRPVIASRIGGLSWVVNDGETWLLFEPGNAADLAGKCARLLDDAQLRDRLGTAGRKQFLEQFTWPVIIDQHYRPLLEGFRNRRPAVNQPSSSAVHGNGTAKRVAVIFDNTQRPETTGIYCRRALGELVQAGRIAEIEHFPEASVFTAHRKWRTDCC